MVKVVFECKYPDIAAFLIVLHTILEDGPDGDLAGSCTLMKQLPECIWFLREQIGARLGDGGWLMGPGRAPEGKLFDFQPFEWDLLTAFVKARIPEEMEGDDGVGGGE